MVFQKKPTCQRRSFDFLQELKPCDAEREQLHGFQRLKRRVRGSPSAFLLFGEPLMFFWQELGRCLWEPLDVVSLFEWFGDV